MNFRVTAQTQYANTLSNLLTQQSNITQVQNQISSGLRVVNPSDDPTAFVQISQAQAASASYATFTQTLSNATGDLNTSTSALQDLNQVLTQAKQLAQQGVDQTLSASARTALATQVNSLIDRAVGDANIQSNGKYVFGGTATDTVPFSVSSTAPNGQTESVVYNGSNSNATALINTNQTVITKYVGSQLLQQSSGDVFASLITLRDTLTDTSLTDNARSTSLSAQIGSLTNAQSNVLTALGTQSASLASLQAIGNRISTLKLNSDTQISNLASTDYPSAVVQLTQQDNSLQATLTIASQIFQTTSSLINFLK